jgi:hypothetical protein
MGVCPCACKKSDTAGEILTEAKDVKNDGQAKSILEVIKEEDSALANQSASNMPLIEEKQDSFNSDHEFLVRAQAAFKGYLERKTFWASVKTEEEPSELEEEPLPDEPPETETQAPLIEFHVDLSQVPDHFLSPKVREKLEDLGKFDFGEPAGKEFRVLFTLVDGSVYQGEVNDQLIPCGKGTIFYEDQSVYEGGWNNGKFQGYGRLVTNEGDVFMGMFEEGQLSGRGKKVFHNGNTYEGELLNSFPHGYGEEFMSDGSFYKGFYRNGLKHGKGIYNWPEGSSYEGMFNEDRIEGFGKYVWPDKVYEGDWKDNIQHGNGVFTWNDGKKYTGGYFLGKKQGFGVFEWPDGKKFEGNWMDGKQDGEGVFSKNGIVKQKGIWVDGKFTGNSKNE